MRKRTQLMLALIFCALYSFSRQPNEVITGKVNDNSGKPYKAATVVLHKSKDSSLVKTDITDVEGKYGFANIKPGAYFVTVTAVGFAKASSAVFSYAEGQPVSIPALILLPASKELKGVVVSGKKPLIEVKADKVILNVEASINATGSNAMELLQKSPGVVVDKDDNISLKGKTGVQIYIDGRPSNMGSTDLAALLRSMNSADIESIEMISNPSAKFEASGNAGIINIKLKKDKRFGVNGNVSVGAAMGKTLKNNNSFSLNYRNKKTNWFGNYSNNFGKNESYIDLYRIQADSIYNQHGIQPNVGNSHNFKVGTDITLDKKSTLGFIVNGNVGNNFGNSTSNTLISKDSIPNILTRTLVASNLTDRARTNFNFNSNYRFADTSGHELNIDANYGAYRGKANSNQPNTYYYANGNLQSQSIYKNNTPTDIDIYTLKVDYEQTLKKGKLGYGGKFSYVQTKNTFDSWNVVAGQDVKNIYQSNNFNYTENVNAVYGNYNGPLSKKYSLQMGLRVEQTNSTGSLIQLVPTPEDYVKKNYIGFFPSAALTYTPNQNNQFTLTYSRRIDRPSYQNLNPFINRLDTLTYQKGNPFLTPQYTNSFEINHIFKYKLSTTLGFSHISDLFAQIIDTTNKTQSFITTKNLAKQNVVSLTIGTPFSFFKIWNGYLNVSSNYSHYVADFGNGKTINLDAVNYTAYAQNSFTLSKTKGLTAELSGFFTGPSIWGGTFKSSPMGSFDVGLQKIMLQGKGTLKLGLTDVAKTLHWHASSNYSANIDTRGGYESRQLRLNFSYRFGSNTVKAARRRNTGSEDENKRLNGSTGIGGTP